MKTYLFKFREEDAIDGTIGGGGVIHFGVVLLKNLAYKESLVMWFDIFQQEVITTFVENSSIELIECDFYLYETTRDILEKIEKKISLLEL